MKIRGEKPFTLPAKLIGSTAALVLAWAIIISSSASYHSNAASDFTAADFSSTSLGSAIAAGEQRLQNNDPDGAAVLAKQALEISPISLEALRTLGLAEQERGRMDSAVAIFSQAAALGWRDVPSQLWLAQANMASGNNDEAARRLDAALRTSPYSNSLYDVVDGIIETGALMPNLAERMTLAPDWRVPYLAYVGPASVQSRVLLVHELMKRSSPPGRKEMLLISNALIGAGRTGEARSLWFSTQGTKPGFLYDPRFEHTGSSDMAPFEWTLLPVLGANVEPNVQANGAHGLIATTDNQASGVLARQFVALPPGQHVLVFDGNLSQPARQAFRWRIRCMPLSVIIVDGVNSPKSQKSFDIPSADCPYQAVELSVGSAFGTARSTANFYQLQLR